MELHGTTRVIEIGAFQFLWNSMEFHGKHNFMEIMIWKLRSAKLAQHKFHGIPWNCSCHRNWRTPKFQGIPWNSMELLVPAKLTHSKLHGIPWNCSCQRYWCTLSSMEFHRNLFICYSMEPLVSSILWVLNLDRISWNLNFQNLMKIVLNFAEWINFRGLISTLYLFVNLFHQLNFYHQYLHYTICICGNVFSMLSPEFHGTFWTTFEQHLWFHGIQWNLSNKISSSMEFHGFPWNFVQIQSSMEFHWTFSILPSSMEFHGTPYFSPKKVPRNSMEFHGTFLKFHGIPWNLINLIFKNYISKYCCWYLIDD